MLKHLSDTNELKEADFIDWGYNKSYVTAIGVGECAGVVIDLVATLLFESEEKMQNAENAIESERWADSIYHAYASMINTAKAVLIDAEIKTNTQTGIISDFDREFVEKGIVPLETSFSSLVNQIRTNEPTAEFAKKYLAGARSFYQTIYNLRSQELSHEVEKTA
jgi:sulfite reductase (ferredoxin)